MEVLMFAPITELQRMLWGGGGVGGTVKCGNVRALATKLCGHLAHVRVCTENHISKLSLYDFL